MEAKHIVAVVCAWVSLQGSWASARPICIRSIEILGAEAGVVLHGTILQVRPLEPDFAHYYNGKIQLTVRVKETLKGSAAGQIRVYCRWTSPKFDQWKLAGTELLLCLQSENGPYAPCPYDLREWIELDDSRTRFGGSDPIDPVDDGSPLARLGRGRGAVTMDFRVLSSRDDILKAARKGIAAGPSGVWKAPVHLTPPLSTGLYSNFAAVDVWMPVDHRLEELGQRWARSNSVEYRMLAARALRPFKSEQNIAILKRLSLDTTHRDHPEGKGGGTGRYMARLLAYNTLREWGVPVPKPVDEESSRGRPSSIRPFFSSARSKALP